MKNNKIIFLQLFIAVVFCKSALAQYGAVRLDTCIKQSEYIFEGHFLSKTCFWGTGPYKNNIYSSCIYKIDKIFKGKLKCGTVEIVGLGGVIGDHQQMNSDGANMSDSGIAMCFSNRGWPSLHASRENPVTLGLNGSISYNGNQGIVYNNDLFPSTKRALYDTFIKMVGHRYNSCNISDELSKQPSIENMNNSTISNKFSPNQVNNFSIPGNDQSIVVYPNPVTNNVNIKIPNDPVVNVIMYDDSGKAVYKLDNTNNAGIQKLDLSFLKPGIYILRAVTVQDNKMYNFKLNKK